MPKKMYVVTVEDSLHVGNICDHWMRNDALTCKNVASDTCISLSKLQFVTQCMMWTFTLQSVSFAGLATNVHHFQNCRIVVTWSLTFKLFDFFFIFSNWIVVNPTFCMSDKTKCRCQDKVTCNAPRCQQWELCYLSLASYPWGAI